MADVGRCEDGEIEKSDRRGQVDQFSETDGADGADGNDGDYDADEADGNDDKAVEVQHLKR